jgi:hypothetical protein
MICFDFFEKNKGRKEVGGIVRKRRILGMEFCNEGIHVPKSWEITQVC